MFFSCRTVRRFTKAWDICFRRFSRFFGENGNTVCMLIIAVLTAVYLVLGGYVAAVITDFVQGIIMLVGVVVMVAIVIKNPIVGGFSEGMRKLSEIVPEGKKPCFAHGRKYVFIPFDERNSHKCGNLGTSSDDT
ncbi:MAG: hypothetical protein L6V93_11920 [Clostridiales bacterium]|nr:MAG: hypothetical protein L6V93_11920 [Clostridiales bacterium]